MLHSQGNVVGGDGEEALQLRVWDQVSPLGLQEGPQGATADVFHDENVRLCSVWRWTGLIFNNGPMELYLRQTPQVTDQLMDDFPHLIGQAIETLAVSLLFQVAFSTYPTHCHAAAGMFLFCFFAIPPPTQRPPVGSVLIFMA